MAESQFAAATERSTKQLHSVMRNATQTADDIDRVDADFYNIVHDNARRWIGTRRAHPGDAMRQACSNAALPQSKPLVIDDFGQRVGVRDVEDAAPVASAAPRNVVCEAWFVAQEVQDEDWDARRRR